MHGFLKTEATDEEKRRVAERNPTGTSELGTFIWPKLQALTLGLGKGLWFHSEILGGLNMRVDFWLDYRRFLGGFKKQQQQPKRAQLGQRTESC